MILNVQCKGLIVVFPQTLHGLFGSSFVPLSTFSHPPLTFVSLPSHFIHLFLLHKLVLVYRLSGFICNAIIYVVLWYPLVVA